jgi:DNA adenine methylase
MAYLGGKATSAEHIIKILNNPFFNDYVYIEPFCGYCHILRRVTNKSSYRASDNNELLIVLLKHVQKTKGEHPHITQAEYTSLRKNPKANKLRAAYAAFCYSYNGKFFGGYVNKYKGRNYPKERKSYYDQLHMNPTFSRTKLDFTSYKKYLTDKTKGALIYCDPPYEGTTEYHSTFNSGEFWEDMRGLSKDNYVFISEYSAPKDFVCVAKKMKMNSVAGGGATRKRIEKVFVHESTAANSVLMAALSGKKGSSETRKVKTVKNIGN